MDLKLIETNKKNVNINNLVFQAIDKNSGEIFDEIELLQNNITFKQVNKNQQEYLKNKSLLQDYNNTLGGFINVYYVSNKLLFSNKLNPSTICRLLYLATYIDYNGENRYGNILCKKTKYNKLEPINKKDIMEILKLKNTTFKRFFTEVTKANILSKTKEGCYTLNTKYFYKGIGNNSAEYTRLYINTTKQLYLNTKTTDHKILGYIFMLIPFINPNNNRLVCREKGDELNSIDICNLLGISVEKSCVSVIKNKLLKFKITVNDNTLPLLAYNIFKTSNKTIECFTLNPNVVWLGNNTSLIKQMLEQDFSKCKNKAD